LFAALSAPLTGDLQPVFATMLEMPPAYCEATTRETATLCIRTRRLHLPKRATVLRIICRDECSDVSCGSHSDQQLHCTRYRCVLNEFILPRKKLKCAIWHLVPKIVFRKFANRVSNFIQTAVLHDRRLPKHSLMPGRRLTQLRVIPGGPNGRRHSALCGRSPRITSGVIPHAIANAPECSNNMMASDRYRSSLSWGLTGATHGTD
jgi:hypothetical protein